MLPIKQEKLRWRMMKILRNRNQKDQRRKEMDLALKNKEKMEVNKWNRPKRMIMEKKVKTLMRLPNSQVKMK